jgi:hypothetical protein
VREVVMTQRGITTYSSIQLDFFKLHPSERVLRLVPVFRTIFFRKAYDPVEQEVS